MLMCSITCSIFLSPSLEAFFILLFSLDLVNSLCSQVFTLGFLSTPKHYMYSSLLLSVTLRPLEGVQVPRSSRGRVLLRRVEDPVLLDPGVWDGVFGERNHEVQGSPPAQNTHQDSLSFENLPCPLSLFF